MGLFSRAALWEVMLKSRLSFFLSLTLRTRMSMPNKGAITISDAAPAQFKSATVGRDACLGRRARSVSKACNKYDTHHSVPATLGGRGCGFNHADGVGPWLTPASDGVGDLGLSYGETVSTPGGASRDASSSPMSSSAGCNCGELTEHPGGCGDGLERCGLLDLLS